MGFHRQIRVLVFASPLHWIGVWSQPNGSVVDRFSRNSCAHHCDNASRISEEGQEGGEIGLTKGQKFRRVLFSRYGVLALISIGLIPLLMALLPGGKVDGDRV